MTVLSLPFCQIAHFITSIVWTITEELVYIINQYMSRLWPLLSTASSASYWYSSEVGISHLSPIYPFRVQHVSALHFLPARRGGGHGMSTAQTHTTYTSANGNRTLTSTQKHKLNKLSKECVSLCRSPRCLLNSRQWNYAASCAVTSSRTPSSPHVG